MACWRPITACCSGRYGRAWCQRWALLCPLPAAWAAAGVADAGLCAQTTDLQACVRLLPARWRLWLSALPTCWACSPARRRLHLPAGVCLAPSPCRCHQLQHGVQPSTTATACSRQARPPGTAHRPPQLACAALGAQQTGCRLSWLSKCTASQAQRPSCIQTWAVLRPRQSHGAWSLQQVRAGCSSCHGMSYTAQPDSAPDAGTLAGPAAVRQPWHPETQLAAELPSSTGGGSPAAASGSQPSAAQAREDTPLDSLLALIQQRSQPVQSHPQGAASVAVSPAAQPPRGLDESGGAAARFPLPNVAGWQAARQELSAPGASTSGSELRQAATLAAEPMAEPAAELAPATPGAQQPVGRAQPAPEAAPVAQVSAAPAQPAPAPAMAVNPQAAPPPGGRPLPAKSARRPHAPPEELAAAATVAAEPSAESVQPLVPLSELGWELQGVQAPSSEPSSPAVAAGSPPMQAAGLQPFATAPSQHPDAGAGLAAEPSAESVQPVMSLAGLGLDLQDVPTPSREPSPASSLPASPERPLDAAAPAARHLLQAGQALPWLSPSPSAVSLASCDSQAGAGEGWPAQEPQGQQVGPQHALQPSSSSSSASTGLQPAHAAPTGAAARHLLQVGQPLPWQLSPSPSAVSLASVDSQAEEPVQQPFVQPPAWPLHQGAALPQASAVPAVQPAAISPAARPASQHLLQPGQALPWASPSPSAVSLASVGISAEAGAQQPDSPRSPVQAAASPSSSPTVAEKVRTRHAGCKPLLVGDMPALRAAVGSACAGSALCCPSNLSWETSPAGSALRQCGASGITRTPSRAAAAWHNWAGGLQPRRQPQGGPAWPARSGSHRRCRGAGRPCIDGRHGGGRVAGPARLPLPGHVCGQAAGCSCGMSRWPQQQRVAIAPAVTATAPGPAAAAAAA